MSGTDSDIENLVRDRSSTLVSEAQYEEVSDDSSTTSSDVSSDDDDAVGQTDEAEIEVENLTVEQAVALYRESQRKLRGAKLTIASLIDQITDYQSVMEQEKEQLQADLAKKDELYEEERRVMAQLLSEAEQNQEQQNAETLRNLTTLMVELENIEETNNSLNDELANEREEHENTLKLKQEAEAKVAELESEVTQLRKQNAADSATTTTPESVDDSKEAATTQADKVVASVVEAATTEVAEAEPTANTDDGDDDADAETPPPPTPPPSTPPPVRKHDDESDTTPTTPTTTAATTPDNNATDTAPDTTAAASSAGAAPVRRPQLRKPHSYVRGLATLAGTKTGGSDPQLHSKMSPAAPAALDAFLALQRDAQVQHYQRLLAAAAQAQAAAPLVARLAATFGHAPASMSGAGATAFDAASARPLGGAAAAAAAAARRASATLHANARRRSLGLPPSIGAELDAAGEAATVAAAAAAANGGGSGDAPASATLESMREMLRHETQMRNAGLMTLRAIPQQASQRVMSHQLHARTTRPGARRGGVRSRSFIQGVGSNGDDFNNNSAATPPARPAPSIGVATPVTREAASAAVQSSTVAARVHHDLELDWYFAGELGASVATLTTGHGDVWCGDAHGMVQSWHASAADDIADALAQLDDDASPPAPPAPHHVWRASEKPIGALLVLGSKLWVGASDGSVAVWSRSGRLVASHSRHKSPVTALLSVPTHKCVWSAAALQIMVWDAKSHKLTKAIETDNYIKSLCVRDKEVWAGTESVIIVYDSATYARLMTLKGHTRVVNCIIVVDDKHVWSCSTDTTICVWTNEGQLTKQINRSAPIMWLAAVERHVWAALRDGSIHIFDKNTRHCIRTIDSVHNGAIHALVVAPVLDSKHVAIWSGSADKSVLVFQTQYAYDASTGTFSTEAEVDPATHSWLKVKFKTATNCKRCENDIWSLVGGRTGYVCRKCKVTVHKKCSKLLKNKCAGRRAPAGSTIMRRSVRDSSSLPSSPSKKPSLGRRLEEPRSAAVLGEGGPPVSPRNVTTTATRGSFAAPPRAHSSLEPPHRRPQTTHYAVSPVRVSEHRNAGSGGSMIVRGESTPVTRQRRNSSAARLKQLQALVPSDDGTHSTSTATDSPREPPPLPPSDERSATPAAAAPSDDADEFAKLIDDAAAAAESDVKRGKSIQHVIDDGVSSSTHSSGSVIGKMNRLFKRPSSSYDLDTTGSGSEERRAQTLNRVSDKNVKSTTITTTATTTSTELEKSATSPTPATASSDNKCERCKKTKARARVTQDDGTVLKLCRKCTVEVTGEDPRAARKNRHNNSRGSSRSSPTGTGTL